MSTRRLEEILEECLSAYLDGRRSVEESLSLYPFYAAELEPLLRTATEINTTLNSYSPPAHVQRRGLNRFLSDARARRNIRALQVGAVRQPGFFGSLWQRYSLGFAGAAMAVIILTVAIGSTALIGSSSGGDTVGTGFQTSEPATPAVVTALRQQIDTLRTRQASQSVTADDIAALLAAAQNIGNADPGDIEPARDTITQALIDANDLVSDIVVTQPEVAPQAQQAQEIIRDVAAGIGAPLPTPSAAVGATTPAVTTEPTPVITETPTIGPSTEATAPPTEAPTPTPAPTPVDSTPPRAPA
jgi:hypothetical protein